MKKGWHLKWIPSLAEADLAICWIWGFQDKFDDMVSPKRWNVVVGVITEFLKFIFKSSEIFDKLITTNCVFRSLKLTKLSIPQPAILCRSLLREEKVSTLEISQKLEEGLLSNIEEECRVESSVYEWMGFYDTFKRSLMKIRKRVGDKTQPCGTPLLIDWGGETDPSIITDKDLSER